MLEEYALLTYSILLLGGLVGNFFGREWSNWEGTNLLVKAHMTNQLSK